FSHYMVRNLKSNEYANATVEELKKTYNEKEEKYFPEQSKLDEFISFWNISGFDESQSRFMDSLQLYLEQLRPNLNLLIEYPYNDKLYRDAYYSYYSTLNRNVNKNCIRISIFDCNLTFEHFNNENLKSQLKEENIFLGFFTLRPTDRKRVGRSFINPKALIAYNG